MRIEGFPLVPKGRRYIIEMRGGGRGHVGGFPEFWQAFVVCEGRELAEAMSAR